MPAIYRKVLISRSLMCLISLYVLQVGFMEKVENDSSIKKKKDTRRPIWNLAHMVNNKSDVNDKIDEGANGIEVDVQFDNDGTALEMKHACPGGSNTKCEGKTDFIEYLQYLRNLTSPDVTKYYRKKLVLLIMDFKFPWTYNATFLQNAGKDVAEKLLEHYWQNGTSGAKAYIILCVPYHNELKFLTSFRETLQNNSSKPDYHVGRIGYDVSTRDNLEIIKSAYENANIKENIWQSDGLANDVLPYRPLTRLTECINIRSANKSYFQKVYFWTVDELDKMQTPLWMGVDAIMSNFPTKVVQVLNSTVEFKRLFRLATLDDDPWEMYTSDW